MSFEALLFTDELIPFQLCDDNAAKMMNFTVEHYPPCYLCTTEIKLASIYCLVKHHIALSARLTETS